MQSLRRPYKPLSNLSMLRRQIKRLLRRLSSNDYLTLNRIELSRSSVLANVRYIQTQHPQQVIIPVLKANAYGHGLVQMASILNDANCAFVAVDGYFEAAQIRDVTRHRLLVLGYIRPENAHLLDTKQCSFVVQDIASLEMLATLKRPVRIHVELETGMHRLGLQTSELEAYLATLKRYPQLQLEGVMTHLADADNPDSSAYTEQQIKSFDQAVALILHAGFQPKFFHIAQTAGSTKSQSHYANALRLGIGLYGINPLKPNDPHFGDLAGLQPALQLKSTIIKTYELQKGERVSYNGIFTAPAAMRIGILPLGYYEGVPRALSNQGCVTAGASVLPIVGRICMNHTILDISGTALNVGDEVTVISADPTMPNSVQQASAVYDLFTYEWLASLSSSVRRVIT